MDRQCEKNRLPTDCKNMMQAKNIFIWCNYRTGSTALTGKLSKKYNLKNYCEAFQPLRPNDTKKFLTEIQTINQNYVVKVMPGQVENNFQKEIESILSNSHVILLDRKNKIDQISSMYVAQTTGVWLEMEGEIQKNNLLDCKIDMVEIQKVCDEIAHNQKLLHTKTYDQKFYYEDINLSNSGFVKQLKPTNYNDIKKEIYFYVYENYPELLEK